MHPCVVVLMGDVSLCLDGRIRPSAVLPPVVSRCGGLSVAVLVVHLGGIWSDRAIGKAAGSLSFANIIMIGTLKGNRFQIVFS